MRPRRVVLAAIVGLLLLVPSALATYPGRAGEIAFEDSYSSFDPLNNGATEYSDTIFATAPGARAHATALECQGNDSGFDSGMQFCPQSAPRFSPDGSLMVVAGVQYLNDGTSSPSQQHCLNNGRCPNGLIVAHADGSAPELLDTGLADAEHPAFQSDGLAVVFAGRTNLSASPDLYDLPLNGMPRFRLTTWGADYPAPCANGALLYVHRGDVYRVPSPGAPPSRLTRKGGASFPDCAQDSRSFVFVRQSTLYTETVDGRHLRRLGSPGGVYSAPALSPAGGRVAVATVRSCTSHCGSPTSACTVVLMRIEVLDLSGHRRASRVVGSNDCSSDGDLGGDAIYGVGWQPRFDVSHAVRRRSPLDDSGGAHMMRAPPSPQNR